MPVSLMRNGLTAENSLFSQRPSVKVPRSKFDLSRLNCFTNDIGMLVPVDLIPTLPDDDFDLSCQYKIDFRPMIVPTMTPYKVRVHYYWCAMSSLWEGWESFISKGRSGNLSLKVPTINLGVGTYSGLTDSAFPTSGVAVTTPSSLVSYLLGICGNHSKYNYLPVSGDGVSDVSGADWNALPFLMYQKIYRSFYLDPNLYSNGIVENKTWFPDDIDSSLWRFNYACSNSVSGRFYPIGSAIPSSFVNNIVPVAQPVGGSGGDNIVALPFLRYAMYSSDMYTTALPFLQRGNESGLVFDINDGDLTASIPSGSSLTFKGQSDKFIRVSAGYASDLDTDVISNFDLLGLDNVSGSATQLLAPLNVSGSNPGYNVTSTAFITKISGSLGNSLSGRVSGHVSTVLTAQKLRDLIAISVWQERNSLTNGSYGQFVKVHFGKYPNNAYYEPVYIGGTSSVFNISSVVQNSSSYVGLNSSGSPVVGTPQGTQTGIGSSSNNGNIGHFHAPDFGYIMAIMSIIPDNVYSGSPEHWNFETSPDDYYMPEFEQLSYQPLQHKYLCFTGDSDVDDSLFGYINRYVYLKQRSSICRGMFALPSSVDSHFGSYVQKRIFDKTTKLTQQMVTCYPPNIDRSFLAVPSEPCFMTQFFSGVKAVRAMSYNSKPNNFGF